MNFLPIADSRVPPRVARVVGNHTEPLAGHAPAVDGVDPDRRHVRHTEHANLNCVTESTSVKGIIGLYGGESPSRDQILLFEDHHDTVPSTGH